MHELGLMTGVMDAAVEAAREAGATRLLGVKVSIGEATEAVEDALVFAFEALAESDPFTQGAKLGLTMIRPRSVCLECATSSSTTSTTASVPSATRSPPSFWPDASCRSTPSRWIFPRSNGRACRQNDACRQSARNKALPYSWQRFCYAVAVPT